jgi:RNA polymerase sigma-70 factor (ECF subfamily)
MTNAALDWLRRAKNRRTTFFDEAFPAQDADGEESGPSQGDSAPEVLRRQEMRERINAAIENLSPEHRAVILLKEVEGLQYNEIGDRLGISIGTVMSRLFYARKALQKQLKDLHEDR